MYNSKFLFLVLMMVISNTLFIGISENAFGLNLGKRISTPTFIPIQFKTYPISVEAEKPLYFELDISPNDTVLGFQISILCDQENGCLPSYTSLNISTDPNMIGMCKLFIN